MLVEVIGVTEKGEKWVMKAYSPPTQSNTPVKGLK